MAKKIYIAQVGRPVNKYEASQLSMYGGGVYTSLAYDRDTDTVLIPMGQMIHTGHSIDKIHTLRMLSNVTFDGTNYPGVYDAYQAFDGSGEVIYNSYTDDSGVQHIDASFNGAGRPFYRGLNAYIGPDGIPSINPADFELKSYVPYSRRFALENPTTSYSKMAIAHAYSAVNASFAYNADSSGFLINDIATNPRVWIPGSDSSGNITSELQSYYVCDRLKKFWEKHAMARDSTYFGTYWNRQVTCGVMGVKAATGRLMMNVSTEGYDLSDHSFTDLGSTQTVWHL